VLTLCASSVCLHDGGKKEYELFEMGYIVSTLMLLHFMYSFMFHMKYCYS
jgi:hypothetical protein